MIIVTDPDLFARYIMNTSNRIRPQLKKGVKICFKNVVFLKNCVCGDNFRSDFGRFPQHSLSESGLSLEIGS
jgi:hypothetical protein